MNCEFEDIGGRIVRGVEERRLQCTRRGCRRMVWSQHPPERTHANCRAVEDLKATKKGCGRGIAKDGDGDVGWLKKGFNFSKAMKSWFTNGMRKVSKKQHDERVLICMKCDMRNPDNNTCRACGCWLAAKAVLAVNNDESDCPLGKWPIIESSAD